jgi:hypothetical protein
MAESILADVVQHGSANVEEGLQRSRRSCEVMAISRPDGLGDIADLGITLSEAKQLFVRVQQQVVAEQVTTHAHPLNGVL